MVFRFVFQQVTGKCAASHFGVDDDCFPVVVVSYLELGRDDTGLRFDGFPVEKTTHFVAGQVE